MKIFCICTVLTLATTVAVAQGTTPPGDSKLTVAASGVAADSTSPATRETAKAREAIATNPKRPDAYTALATAFSRRAQETADLSYYAQADEAVSQALTLDPGNFDAEKARVVVALGRHEFAQALELATTLNKRVPDDVLVYGYLVDADSALGNYSDAEQAAQWMLNLRPGNVPALIRTAKLREAFGDQEGASEVLKMILDSAPNTIYASRPWTLTQIAKLNLQIGKLDVAEAALSEALTIDPGYFDALDRQAQLRLLQGRPADAVELLRQSYKLAPQTATLYALAEAMQAAGMKDNAKSTFAEFEQRALRESSLPYNANRQLIFYYADHAGKPNEALRIAQIEIAHRHDIATLDAYGWALYRSGNYSEAKQQLDLALKVGVNEAPVYYHAGAIALKLNNSAEAERYLRLAAQLHSLQSAEAGKVLAALPSHPPPAN